MDLSVDRLSVFAGRTQILKDVSLSVRHGEFLALLGPSGCGKSTLLKTVAGLLPASGGRISLGGRDLSPIPPHRRGTVIVFQDMRLFPHLPVAENVAFPLKMRGVGRRERLARAEELLQRVQLSGYGPRAVPSLSGGQQQRVALARALAAQPDVLLLDEPFSSLDEDLREEMRRLVLSLHREHRMTTVLVTHDQQEALSMADRVAMMFSGRVVQCGTPQEVYFHPASRRVADYFGGCAYLDGQVSGGRFTCPDLSCPAPVPDGDFSLLLRPAALLLDRPGPLALRLEGCRFRGADVVARWVTDSGVVLDVPRPVPPPWPAGHRITCQLDMDQLCFFPRGEEVPPAWTGP